MDALGLPEFETINIQDSSEYMKFIVKAKNHPFFCTECLFSFDYGSKEKFSVHDTRKRIVADEDYRGKKVVLEVYQRRFLCPYCGKKFTEFFESISRRDKVTLRLWDRIGKEALVEPFLKVAKKYGVSHTTVQRAFKDCVQQKDAERVLKAPTVLGIDEVYVKIEQHKRKLPLVVFTDIENKKILEIINVDDFNSIRNIILSMEGYENIKAVTMDMCPTYLSVAKSVLPNAYCVVDHYHVIQKTNMALDTIRTSIQKGLKEGDKDALFKVKDSIRAGREILNPNRMEKLDAQLELYPKLKMAYWLKEGLRSVYKAKSKYEANQLYYEWECQIDNYQKQHHPIKQKDMRIPEIEGIRRMINRLRPQVFAYFDGHYTNAFTERFNRSIKDFVRVGNGYRFDSLRAKVLYGTSATKSASYKDMNFYTIELAMVNGFNKDEIETESVLLEGFGVDINELFDLIDKGEFEV